MIGKIIAGSSFAGTVGYVVKKQSRILDAEGVTPPNIREMVQDFKDQILLNPRIKNARRTYLPFVFTERQNANDRFFDAGYCQRVYAAHGNYRHAIPAGASSRPIASALPSGL